MQKSRAPAECAGQPEGDEDHQNQADGGGRTSDLCQQPTDHQVINQPPTHQHSEAQSNSVEQAQVGDRRIHQQCAAAGVVDHPEENDTCEPGGVRLPLEPVQRPRPVPAPEVLFYVIKAATVEQPDLPLNALLSRRGRQQVAVEPVEQERVADPHDPSHNMYPAENQVQDLPRARVHSAPAVGGVPERA